MDYSCNNHDQYDSCVVAHCNAWWVHHLFLHCLCILACSTTTNKRIFNASPHYFLFIIVRTVLLNVTLSLVIYLIGYLFLSFDYLVDGRKSWTFAVYYKQRRKSSSFFPLYYFKTKVLNTFYLIRYAQLWRQLHKHRILTLLLLG